MASPLYIGAEPASARALCVVVHGRGQSQEDMTGAIVHRVTAPDVRFALPKSDDLGWYLARAVDPLTDETLTAMHHGVRQITALIKDLKAASPGRPVVLCGFSQGACMVVETLMCQSQIVDAACLFTGCRIGAVSDDLPLNQLEGLPIYASCGDADPWIPAQAHHRMVADLTRAGARLRSDMFPGRPHEVTATEIAALSGMLADASADRLCFGDAV